MKFFAWEQVLAAHDTWDTHEGSGSPSSGNHSDDRMITWRDNWSLDKTLPSFSCGGTCNQTFDTPRGDHWATCGSALNVNLAAWDVARQIKANNPDDAEELENTYPNAYDAIVNKGTRLNITISSIVHVILKNRTVDEGCGRGYFNCDSSSHDLHSIRTCDVQRTWVDDEDNVTTTGTCNDRFRLCIGHSIVHNPLTNSQEASEHEGQAPGLYFPNSSTRKITVNGNRITALDSMPEETHTGNLITRDGGFTMIYWYLLSPGDTRQHGDELTDSPTNSPTYGQNDGNTEVPFSITIPDAPGVYKFTVIIHPSSSASDTISYEFSYYIYSS